MSLTSWVLCAIGADVLLPVCASCVDVYLLVVKFSKAIPQNAEEAYTTELENGLLSTCTGSLQSSSVHIALSPMMGACLQSEEA